MTMHLHLSEFLPKGFLFLTLQLTPSYQQWEQMLVRNIIVQITMFTITILPVLIGNIYREFSAHELNAFRAILFFDNAYLLNRND